jgi:hypothetical protein
VTGSTARSCAAAALLAAGWCFADGGGSAAYEIRPWFEVSERKLSPFGKAVHDGESDDFLHAETKHFVLHAQTLRDIDESAAQAEQALAHVTAALGIPAPKQKIQILRVADPAAWDALVKDQSIRPDGLALQVKNEVILKDSAAYRARERVAHEVAHACMRDAFGSYLPLWFEEGLAGSLGRDAFAAGLTAEERAALPKIPAVTPSRVYALKMLTSIFVYPPDPADAALFYRMAEDLVAVLRDKMGEEKFNAYVKSMGQGFKQWDQVLRQEFQFADGDFDDLAKRLQDRALTELPW